MKLILRGVGVCKGFAQGKVRILEDITKPLKIEEGCILVMPFFTPILSMLISKASGVIANFGGITSHAAVIAREFGVPCIVGVNNATKILEEGQLIYLDGEKGEIYEL